jgi:hypothetical protein
MHKSISSMIHHINKVKNRNHHVITSRDADKASNEIQHPFMIKNSLCIRYRGNVHQHNKSHHDKPPANIIMMESRRLFLHNQETKQGCPSPPLLFNIVLKVLIATARNKRQPTCKGRSYSTCWQHGQYI